MEELAVGCPYCGEQIEVIVDTSVGEQEYYEDCSVCCCPIFFKLFIAEQQTIKLIVLRDDE